MQTTRNVSLNLSLINRLCRVIGYRSPASDIVFFARLLHNTRIPLRTAQDWLYRGVVPSDRYLPVLAAVLGVKNPQRLIQRGHGA